MIDTFMMRFGRRPIRISLLISLFLVLIGCSEHSQPTPPDDGELCYVQIDDNPAWSPDGQYIAYYHYGVTAISDDNCEPLAIDYAKVGIWIMNADGSNPHLFVQGANFPAWSADSKWIYFVQYGTWKVKLNGDSLAQISIRASNWYDVSPSNYLLAFQSNLGQSAGIWIANLNFPDSLIHWNSAGGPQWHPSSDSIFWSHGTDGYWIEALDHSFKRKLHDKPPGTLVEAINYCAATQMIVTAAEGYIYTFNINGNDFRGLPAENASRPVWSPDGQYIAYTGVSGGKLIAIWVMKSDGSERKQLTTFTALP